MKTITIPATITVEAQPKPITMSFAKFLDEVVFNHQAFTTSGSTMRLAAKLLDAAEKVSPGEEWLIDDAHHALMLEAIEKPAGGHYQPVARKLLPHFDAIAEAK